MKDVGFDVENDAAVIVQRESLLTGLTRLTGLRMMKILIIL
jgi:hypothetical protein